MASKQVLLTIYNHHITESGDPPAFDNSDMSKYYGYFENEHGEQWVFIYDYETEVALVRGGDAGWDRKYVVVNGTVPLIVDAPEKQWLAAYWDAATAFKKYREIRRQGEGTQNQE